MILTAFKTEFERIATLKGAEFTTKEISELQEYVQSYNFDNPLINFVPLSDFGSEIGASSQVIYDGVCKLQFLTKANVSDNAETVKDGLIDSMITLATGFYRSLDQNETLIFASPRWKWNNQVLRQYTSNYLVGVESTITFKTACNRI